MTCDDNINQNLFKRQLEEEPKEEPKRMRYDNSTFNNVDPVAPILTPTQIPTPRHFIEVNFYKTFDIENHDNITIELVLSELEKLEHYKILFVRHEIHISIINLHQEKIDILKKQIELYSILEQQIDETYTCICSKVSCVICENKNKMLNKYLELCNNVSIDLIHKVYWYSFCFNYVKNYPSCTYEEAYDKWVYEQWN